MDLSREFTQDEDRILQRQLYRPGQAAKPAVKTPTPVPASARTIAKPSIASTPAAKPKLPTKDGPPSRLQSVLKRIAVVAVVLLFLLGLGAATYYAFSPDPVEEVKKEFAELREKAKDMTPDERKAAFKQAFENKSKLTPKQRNEVDKEWRNKMNEKLDNFFKLPKDKQVEE